MQPRRTRKICGMRRGSPDGDRRRHHAGETGSAQQRVAHITTRHRCGGRRYQQCEPRGAGRARRDRRAGPSRLAIATESAISWLQAHTRPPGGLANHDRRKRHAFRNGGATRPALRAGAAADADGGDCQRGNPTCAGFVCQRDSSAEFYRASIKADTRRSASARATLLVPTCATPVPFGGVARPRSARTGLSGRSKSCQAPG